MSRAPQRVQNKAALDLIWGAEKLPVELKPYQHQENIQISYLDAFEVHKGKQCNKEIGTFLQ